MGLEKLVLAVFSAGCLLGCETRQPELGEEVLMNMEYGGASAAQSAFELKAGSHTETAGVGASSRVAVTFEDFAVGKVSGVPTAAVILKSASGGSGVFYDLAVVTARDGTFVNTDREYVGDRVKIQAVDIQGDAIVLEMVTHGPEEPLCCPTVSWKQRYQVVDGRLRRPDAG